MPKERESNSGNEPVKEPFVTIDDLVQQADQLAGDLHRLSEYRHPLDVRRGVGQGEEVTDMKDLGDSVTVKAGAKTYFLDVKKTKEDKPFLVITESRFKGEGKDRERASITVFPESAAEFGQALAGMIEKLGE
jgi:hypothetical protein